MKKISLIIIALMLLNVMTGVALAAEANLIEDTQINLKASESRVLVSFELTEPIDLSQGNSDIVFDYLTMDDNGNLRAIPYRKNKLWSGYLNSYDNLPAGEHKYSSGYENAQYPDEVPATRIYTSTKSNANIDVMSVAAIAITVLRADSSGEKVTCYIDGTVSDVEEIAADVADDNISMGIIMESATAELPEDTILVANELIGGSVYEQASLLLTDAKHFIAIDITLESGGAKIQPNGKVRISIPIPEYFGGSNLAVYRIDDDGAKIPYPVTITSGGETRYATFEADHFSAYVLAEMLPTEAETETESGIPLNTEARVLARERTRENTEVGMGEYLGEGTITEIEENEIPLTNVIPQTGAAQTSIYYIAAVIISVLAAALLLTNKQKG